MILDDNTYPFPNELLLSDIVIIPWERYCQGRDIFCDENYSLASGIVMTCTTPAPVSFFKAQSTWDQ